jgi:hypothetical protein
MSIAAGLPSKDDDQSNPEGLTSNKKQIPLKDIQTG